MVNGAKETNERSTYTREEEEAAISRTLADTDLMSYMACTSKMRPEEKRYELGRLQTREAPHNAQKAALRQHLQYLEVSGLRLQSQKAPSGKSGISGDGSLDGRGVGGGLSITSLIFKEGEVGSCVGEEGLISVMTLTWRLRYLNDFEGT